MTGFFFWEFDIVKTNDKVSYYINKLFQIIQFFSFSNAVMFMTNILYRLTAFDMKSSLETNKFHFISLPSPNSAPPNFQQTRRHLSIWVGEWGPQNRLRSPRPTNCHSQGGATQISVYCCMFSTKKTNQRCIGGCGQCNMWTLRHYLDQLKWLFSQSYDNIM